MNSIQHKIVEGVRLLENASKFQTVARELKDVASKHREAKSVVDKMAKGQAPTKQEIAKLQGEVQDEVVMAIAGVFGPTQAMKITGQQAESTIAEATKEWIVIYNWGQGRQLIHPKNDKYDIEVMDRARAERLAKQEQKDMDRGKHKVMVHAKPLDDKIWKYVTKRSEAGWAVRDLLDELKESAGLDEKAMRHKPNPRRNKAKFDKRHIDLAVSWAKKMKGDMTGATKKIEDIARGLSDDPKVQAALRQYNESVNEAANQKVVARAMAKEGPNRYFLGITADRGRPILHSDTGAALSLSNIAWNIDGGNAAKTTAVANAVRGIKDSKKLADALNKAKLGPKKWTPILMDESVAEETEIEEAFKDKKGKPLKKGNWYRMGNTDMQILDILDDKLRVKKVNLRGGTTNYVISNDAFKDRYDRKLKNLDESAGVSPMEEATTMIDTTIEENSKMKVGTKVRVKPTAVSGNTKKYADNVGSIVDVRKQPGGGSAFEVRMKDGMILDLRDIDVIAEDTTRLANKHGGNMTRASVQSLDFSQAIVEATKVSKGDWIKGPTGDIYQVIGVRGTTVHAAPYRGKNAFGGETTLHLTKVKVTDQPADAK